MWKAFFLAVGITLVIVGVECLAVDYVTLRLRDAPPPAMSPWDTPPAVGPQRTFTPKTWAPWSLISSGAVVCLYSFTIPRRVKGQ